MALRAPDMTPEQHKLLLKAPKALNREAFASPARRAKFYRFAERMVAEGPMQFPENAIVWAACRCNADREEVLALLPELSARWAEWGSSDHQKACKALLEAAEAAEPGGGT